MSTTSYPNAQKKHKNNQTPGSIAAVMNNSPNPSRPSSRYQMIRELGRNRAGGRITYLAKDNNTQQLVVIKRFLFAQSGSDWSGFKAYQREIQVLQGLDHVGIPHYLDSFETKSGFCMVQEYKDAQSLAIPRSFDAEQIKQIAICALEILIYLQSRLPVVMHRDIKPENILLDEHLNVYLVDFGLARVGVGEMAMSSVAAGTFGFMAPEQIYNRQLSEATDLYGLGATLICLLTGTKSTEMDALISEEGRITFKHLLPTLSLRFVDWLEKLVEPKIKDRFPNAAAALEALKPIDVIRTPEAKLSRLVLDFKTKQPGEKLTQTIKITNSVPETLLEGHWEVAPHRSDPRYIKNSHVWISLEPDNFQGNQVDCRITVNTGRLMVDQTYSRQILLHTNASPEPQVLTLNIHTALPEIPKLPYISLGLLFVSAWVLAGFGAASIAWVISMASAFGAFVPVVLLAAGFVAGFSAGALLSSVGLKAVPKVKIGLWGIGLAVLTVVLSAGFLAGVVATFLGFAGLLIGLVAGAVIKNHKDSGFSQNFAGAIALLDTGLGMSLGAGFNIGFSALLTVCAMGLGIALIGMMLHPRQLREQLLTDYRQSAEKKRLIKP
jgi:serine/threonine protein kinase